MRIVWKGKTKVPYKRFCRGCGKYFQPNGKFNYYCEKCMDERWEKGREKIRKKVEKKWGKKVKKKSK